MKKKGKWLNIFALIATLSAFVYLFLSSAALNPEGLGHEHFIGEKQIDLIDIYPKAEIALLYYDKLATYVLPKSLFNLGLLGGFKVESPCGLASNYNLWFNESGECKPNYKKSLSYHLQNVFGIYFDSVPDPSYIIDHKSYYFSTHHNDGFLGVDAAASTPLIFSGKDIEYAFRPSVKMGIEYNIDVYDILFEKARLLKKECINTLDYESCVAKKLSHLSTEIDGMEWKADCNKDDEKIFYSFVQNYKSCMDSFGQDCTCSFSMDIDDIKPGDYKIKLYDGGNVVLNGLEENLDISPSKFGKNALGIEQYDNIDIIFRYDEDGFSGARIIPGGGEWEDGERFDAVKIYKDALTDYKDEHNFAFVQDVSGKDMCRSFSRTANICVEDRNEHLIYHEGEVGKRKIPIKFGIYFNDIFPPEATKDVEVVDQENAEGSVVLSFAKNEDEDIHSYKIYYSEDAFTNTENAVLYTELLHDFLNDPQIVIYGLEDGKKYYFAVAPKDVFGNENDNIISIEGIPIDDVAPGRVKLTFPEHDMLSPAVIDISGDENSFSLQWERPLSNQNGQPLKDLEGYFVYFSKVPFIEIPSILTHGLCASDPNCRLADSGKEAIMISVEEGRYYAAVTAFDETFNYISDFDGDPDILAALADITPENEEVIVPLNAAIIDGIITAPISILQDVYNQEEKDLLFGRCDESLLTNFNFFGRNILVNSKVLPQFSKVKNDIISSGISYDFWRDLAGGTYNCRQTRGSSKMSPHAYGMAIDINPGANPYYPRVSGAECKTDLPPAVIAAFKRNDFCWGGHFTRMCDAMHFEYCGEIV